LFNQYSAIVLQLANDLKSANIDFFDIAFNIDTFVQRSDAKSWSALISATQQQLSPSVATTMTFGDVDTPNKLQFVRQLSAIGVTMAALRRDVPPPPNASLASQRRAYRAALLVAQQRLPASLPFVVKQLRVQSRPGCENGLGFVARRDPGDCSGWLECCTRVAALSFCACSFVTM
jgi:hypothetical protein